MTISFALAGAALACAGAPPAPAPAPAPGPRAASSSGAPAPGARSRLAFPPAARRAVAHEYFGTRVVDDYEWLEDGKSAETAAFTAAQNAAARALLDGIPGRAKIRARVAELAQAASADYLAVHVVEPPSASSSSSSSSATLFVLVAQPPKQQPVLVTRAESAEAATQRVVVDPNVLDPSGKTTIDWYVPSPDGKLVAVSLSKNGSESGDVHVYEAATGKEQGDVVTRAHGGTAGGSLAWNGDGTGFFYTRYPRAGERAEADLEFFQQIWFHQLGTPEARDVYSLGKDFPRIAEVDLARSDDGRFVLARVANGDGGEYEHHVLTAPGRGKIVAPGAATWVRLATFKDELIHSELSSDGKVYAISRKGAPRGKVLAFAPPFDKPAETVLEEGDGVIEGIVATRGALYVAELLGGPSRMRRIPLGAKPEPLARDTSKPAGPARPKKGGASKAPAPASTAPITVPPGARGVVAAELPVPPVSSVTGAVRVGEDLLVRMESYLEPPAWYRYRASEHRFVKTAMAKSPPADMSDVEVVRETCVSKDGTRVPLSVLRRKGTTLDGRNRTLLTGYGGFGLSRKPRLRAWYRAWLERGGVLAEANLRGGGEMGAAWHDAGKLTKKQNVFDDFAACAKAVVDLGYTKPERLAIWGRSNGGLLVGAAIVQHPEMFRAAVSGVGIYDMLRVELSSNGAFNVTEFGTVKDEAQFRALHAYSPLHNVKDGTAYPAVLFTTGAHDPRVDPYHSRKMTARLQAATSSDRPVLLLQSADTGHGMGTPLSAEIEETTDLLAFLFRELGGEEDDR